LCLLVDDADVAAEIDTNYTGDLIAECAVAGGERKKARMSERKHQHKMEASRVRMEKIKK
jgi:hypothetical protein